MPRRKTQSGAPAQPVAAAPGQPYGERAAQEQDQAQVPLPDAASAGPVAPVPQLSQQALEGAMAMEPPPPGGILGGESLRPNEPVTAGIAHGPGPGPEVVGLQPQSRAVRTLELAASVSTNPAIARLLASARQQLVTPGRPAGPQPGGRIL